MFDGEDKQKDLAEKGGQAATVTIRSQHGGTVHELESGSVYEPSSNASDAEFHEKVQSSTMEVYEMRRTGESSHMNHWDRESGVVHAL